jgi:hypothetical protein
VPNWRHNISLSMMAIISYPPILPTSADSV